LQHVGFASPHAIYWKYIDLRAKCIDVVVETPEQIAFARVACLTRATVETIRPLQEAWSSRSSAERSILVEFLLLDGIYKRAEVFSFLPLYFENAKKNPVVGLSLALEVLVNLVELRRTDSTSAEQAPALEINLSDLAAFARQVKCSNVFKQVSQNSLFADQGDSVHHLVSGDLWAQVNSDYRQSDPSLRDIQYLLTKVAREAFAMKRPRDSESEKSTIVASPSAKSSDARKVGSQVSLQWRTTKSLISEGDENMCGEMPKVSSRPVRGSLPDLGRTLPGVGSRLSTRSVQPRSSVGGGGGGLGMQREQLLGVRREPEAESEEICDREWTPSSSARSVQEPSASMKRLSQMVTQRASLPGQIAGTPPSSDS